MKDELLELPNVVGYREKNGKVTVFVTEKVSEDELEEHEIVSNVVDMDSDVCDCGGEFTFVNGKLGKHRPVEAGVSEINSLVEGAGTCGFIANVNDKKGVWENVDVDKVRISNNHVYARKNEAELGEGIIQPSSLDGGDYSDRVGELVGYVPLRDGVTVDVAARAIETDESDKIHKMGDYSDEVVVGDLDDLKLTKSGRTTGVTEFKSMYDGATIKVKLDEEESVIFRDVLITAPSIEAGDSGSPVVLNADKPSERHIVGLVFAGSPAFGVICKAENIEREFGVTLGTVKHESDMSLLGYIKRWFFSKIPIFN